MFVCRQVPGLTTCQEDPKQPVKFWEENILLPDLRKLVSICQKYMSITIMVVEMFP